MKTLIISQYPPMRDGVAAYAAQVAAELRAQGHEVEVLSPEPTAAPYNANLKTAGGTLAAIRLARRADKVVVHFTPETFFTGMDHSRFASGWMRLLVLFSACSDVEVVVHEAPYAEGGRSERLRTAMWGLLWRRPARVVLHSDTERRLMRSAYSVPDERLVLTEHGESFRRHSTMERRAARHSLGIEPSQFVFLCIGFLQPHKGFDRAAIALSRLKGDHLRLDTVGDIRVKTPEHQAYLELLAQQASSDARITLHQGYVSDELFDRWIIASDVVVLPYREIWSSSVVERAALYDREVVVTDVGGLAEQAGPAARVVHDPEGLALAMAELAGVKLRNVAEIDGQNVSATFSELAQRQVREGGEALRQWYDPLELVERPAPGYGAGKPEADVRRGPLAVPPGRPGLHPKAVLQRAVRRLTGWELEPMVTYINALREELGVAPEVKRRTRGVG